MQYIKKIIPLTLLLFFCILSSPAFAKNIKMDFQNADLHEVIRYISEMTGRNIVANPNISGKVTVYSPVSITLEQAFETFIAIMKVHGYAVQKNGDSYVIVPYKEALQLSEATIIGKEEKTLFQTVETRIIPLKNGIAQELAKVLPSILIRDYAISAYAPSNTLAITAPAPAMATALSFINQVEETHKQGKTLTKKLVHGNAEVLADSLSMLLKAKDEEISKKGGISISLVIPDERTNTILVYGDADAIAIAEKTISKLDIPTPKGKGDIHHITLSNGKAEDIALVINTLVERQVAGTSSEEEQELVLSKDVKVVPDIPTNSLVITARSDEFEALTEIIAKLDIERQQVFIEALIMEVNNSASTSFGINWGIGTETGNVGVIGGVNLGGGNINLGSNKIASLPSGISIGSILLDAITVGGTDYNIQSILNLSKGNADIDVIATPQLLTLNNEEATFEVVDNIPFTKESTASNDAAYTTQTLDYKDVGIKLKITPRISKDGSLRLEVEQEISRVTQGIVTLEGGDQLLAPTTRKRYIKSTILLHDGHTAVIGGLLDDSVTNTENEVPWLASIPGFGWLFNSRTKVKTQTNLFVFITPKIIRNYNDMNEMTGQKQVSLHQTRIGKNGLALPMMSKPKLQKPIFVH